MYKIDIVNKIQAKNKVEVGQVYQDGRGLTYVVILCNAGAGKDHVASYGLLNLESLEVKEWRCCTVEMECLIQAANLAYIGKVKNLSVEVE